MAWFCYYIVATKIPTLSDNVTINTGQILTIPSGEKAFAGTLNDKGTLRNFGTLNMGKATTTDLYTQSYKYHIRGGLKSINTDANNDLTNSLFSYKLTYEDGGFYDGNIGNQYWKSSIDGKQRAYAYQYDGDSRLKSATYASTQAGENYSLNNVDYDGNGNITNLSRNGATNNNFTSFGNVDNLTYTYQSNSNKLLKIADATTSNADLGDFRDGTNTGDDYEYWADGSLKKDRNKKIASITYNFLKRPEIITFDNGRTITTEYDADGTKLKKIDSNGEVTDYEEDDIYVNNVLYQTSHDEGRIANGIFEYNITDHNNDLRVSFRDSLGIAVPVQSIFYDPWGLSMKGMQITRNPTNFNKYQFLNRETQFETGYIDLINRQFDPQTGRFVSQDPVIEGQEHLSLYQYGWNNPVLKSDPDGLKPGEESPYFKSRRLAKEYIEKTQPVKGYFYAKGEASLDAGARLAISPVKKIADFDANLSSTPLVKVEAEVKTDGKGVQVSPDGGFKKASLKNEGDATVTKGLSIGVIAGVSVKEETVTDQKTHEKKADKVEVSINVGPVFFKYENDSKSNNYSLSAGLATGQTFGAIFVGSWGVEVGAKVDIKKDYKKP